MNQIQSIERRIKRLRRREIPGISVTYIDGTAIHATGFYESLTAVLDRGDVANIDGDGDLAALARALMGGRPE